MKKEIVTTIKLILKCQNQPIILQILISHLLFLLSNTDETQLSSCKSDIEKLLFLCRIKTNKQNKSIEKSILQYLIDNRKKYCNFKLRLILTYLINQDVNRTNFFILNELLHNYMFSNILNDFLIIKYLTRVSMSKYFGTPVKNRIQDDILRSFLLQLRNKTTSLPIWNVTLPLYVNTNIEPPCLHFTLPDLFIHKLLESLYIYCSFEKDKSKVKALLSSSIDLKNDLLKFIKKTELDYVQTIDKCNIEYIFLETYSIFDDIVYKLEETSDKKHFLANLMKFCNKLQKKYENK